MERDSILLYRNFYNLIKVVIPKERRTDFYEKVLEFGFYGTVPTFETDEENAVWGVIYPQMEANNRKYVKGCKGKEYGVNGGAPKGNQNARKTETNTFETSVTEEEEKHGVEETPAEKPTLSEVKEFAKANGYTLDVNKFYDFYNSSNWESGGKPVKNWRALLLSWEEKYLEEQRKPPKSDNYGGYRTAPKKEEFMTHRYTQEQLDSVLFDFDNWDGSSPVN